ncbi:MAG TPA: YCF48-related protein [Candidatus Acidoferrales bacterium]|nr:YCF48-related protein [Candidatus Acidoferrales bacterium]
MTEKHNPDQAIAAMLKSKGVWPTRPERSEGVLGAQSCPDADTLAAYFESSLSPAEIDHWEMHFSSCARCQEQLAALVRSERPTQTELAEGKKRALWWLWNWRFLTPIGAAAIVILAVVISQQTMRAPLSRSGGELMAKREVTRETAPAATEPRKPPESAPAQKQGEGPASVDELQKKNLSAAEGESRANLEVQRKRAVTSPRVGAGAGLAGRSANSAVASDRLAGAAIPAAPPPPAAAAAETAVQVESAKSQQRPAEAARAQAAPAPAQTETVTVEAIQKQERDAKIAEQKARADQAISAVQLKRETAGKEQGAVTPQARARFGIAGGALGARLLAEPGEFIVITPNPKILWRFGPSGLIERSRDAGKSWERQASPTQEAFLAGFAPSDKVCWVGAKNGVLLRTTDGGEKWEAIPSPIQGDVAAVKAFDQFRVTVTDADGRVFETTNAGRQWRVR